jgi:hypothetical protein
MAARLTRAAAIAALGLALGAPAAAAPRPALVGPALGPGYHAYRVGPSLLALCPLHLLVASPGERRGAWSRASDHSVVAEGVTLAASASAAAVDARADARVVARCAPVALVDGLAATQRLRVATRTAASTTWSEHVTTVAGGYAGYVAVGHAGRAVVVLGWGLDGSVGASRFAALLRTALARA